MNFSVDMTELTEAEKELKVQSRVLDSMAKGGSFSDEDGVRLYTNLAFDEIFGCERGELIGAQVSILNTIPPKENRGV